MTSNSRTHRTRSLAGIAAAALVLASCGSSDDDAAAPADSVEAGTDDALDEADASGLVEVAPVEIDGEVLEPFGASADDPTIGAAAPVVSGQSFDGTPVTFGGPSDDPTLVVFLAHWCPACNAELPELVELADTGAFPAGLDVLAVATASTPERDNYPPSEWLDTNGWMLPTMADSAASEAFVALGGASFPYMVVLDADGTVLARKDGVSSGADTVAFLDATLATSAT